VSNLVRRKHNMSVCFGLSGLFLQAGGASFEKGDVINGQSEFSNICIKI